MTVENEGLLKKKIESLKWLPDDMEGFDETENKRSKVVTYLEILQILDVALKEFPVRKALFSGTTYQHQMENDDAYISSVLQWKKKWFGFE